MRIEHKEILRSEVLPTCLHNGSLCFERELKLYTYVVYNVFNGNYMMFPLVFFFTPAYSLRLCIASFAVAERWLLLDIGLFVLFVKNCIRL